MRNLPSVACGLVLAACSLFAAGEYSGRRAPGFALPDSNLQHFDLADYRGKVVVIEMMSTGCHHCEHFAPTLEKIQQKYGDDVAVLSIVTYPPDSQATVAAYKAKTKTTVPILFDCGQVTRVYLKITPLSSQRDLPHVFLIDREGMIRNDFAYGPDNKAIFEGDGLLAEIDKLLGGKVAEPRRSPAPKPQQNKKGDETKL
ncbi:MAG: TlpA family protein disulfide reductase [Bryobacteraceae bacterium]